MSSTQEHLDEFEFRLRALNDKERLDMRRLRRSREFRRLSSFGSNDGTHAKEQLHRFSSSRSLLTPHKPIASVRTLETQFSAGSVSSMASRSGSLLDRQHSIRAVIHALDDRRRQRQSKYDLMP